MNGKNITDTPIGARDGEFIEAAGHEVKGCSVRVETLGSALNRFWKSFDGKRCPQRGYKKKLKIALLKEMAELQFPLPKSLWKTRSEFRCLNPTLSRNCFACSARGAARHHIVQLQHGGDNSKRNLIPLCADCHAEIHPWLKKQQDAARTPDRYEKIEPTLRQIYICAKEHRTESVHLDAIAKILEEWLK